MAKSQIINPNEPDNPTVTMTLDELRLLIAGGRVVDEYSEEARERKIADWKMQARINAEADRGAKIPEVFGSGPQKSVYNPHGDVRDAHYPDGKPRGELLPPYPVYILGMKVTEHSTMTYGEMALLKDVRPGSYWTMKDDETKHYWEVRGEHDSDGTLTKLVIDSKSSMKDQGKRGLGRFDNILKAFIAQHAEKKSALVLA